jgi:hypothetical protein
VDDDVAFGTIYTYVVVAVMNDGTDTTPATRIFSNFATIETPEAPLQIVDFEQFDNNDGYPGPFFTSVEPPRTVGIATFSGGQLLNETASHPVNQTVIYGTANICTGCLSTITITFSQPVTDFSVFLMNGQTVTVTYTVQDVDGETETTVELAPNAESGAETVVLPGDGITHVTITPSGEFTNWDFLIDNVEFRPM